MNSASDRTYQDRQEDKSNMSQNKFSWIVGVGFWGVATAVSFALYTSWKTGSPVFPWIGLASLLFLPGGYIFGYTLWDKLQLGGAASRPKESVQAGDGSPRR